MPFLPPRAKRLLPFLLVLAIGLSFAIYTKHAWEDWYITYRASKNLATGNGLVFTPGERIHSFTSPLGTLLPALLSAVTFNVSDPLVLWLFRIAGCILLGGTALLMVTAAGRWALGRLPLAFLLGMFATSISIIDFSINGMESAFMVFFLALALYALSEAPLRPALLGLAWAGLMWTRPDSFVYIGGISLGWLIFARPAPGAFRSSLSPLLRSLAVCLAVYLPWILFAWWYYGTPVPHTIAAKGLLLSVAGKDMLGLWKSQFLADPFRLGLTSLTGTFMPPNYFFGGWSPALAGMSCALASICAFYWLLPFAAPPARMISFGLLCAHGYLSYLPPRIFAWYIVPVTFLSLVVLAFILRQALSSALVTSARDRGWKTGIIALAGMAFVMNVFVFLNAGYELKLQQRIIEEGHRKRIGLWLKANASPGDTVYLEPLGYIGFFSGLKFYDQAGLASAEVVAVVKKRRSGMPAVLISELRPDWLVMRPNEIDLVTEEMPAVWKDYKLEKMFDCGEAIARHRYLPGRQYLYVDRTYIVFRRKSAR